MIQNQLNYIAESFVKEWETPFSRICRHLQFLSPKSL